MGDGGEKGRAVRWQLDGPVTGAAGNDQRLPKTGKKQLHTACHDLSPSLRGLRGPVVLGHRKTNLLIKCESFHPKSSI